MFDHRWTCANCGATYRALPDRCPACGDVCLEPTDDSPGGRPPNGRRRDRRPDGAASRTWVCTRCERAHDYEPISCADCGCTSLVRVGSDDEPRHPDIGEGFPTPTTDVRREFARGGEESVDWREALLVVLLCVAFLLGLFLYAVI